MNTNTTYKHLFQTIKQQIQQAQVKTVMAANSQMLLLYWQLGNYIIENQHAEGWGAKIIEKLSADLREEFPEMKGFSIRNLFYMKRFAQTYTINIIQVFNKISNSSVPLFQKVQQVAAQFECTNSESLIIMQQAAAQFQDNDFIYSIVGKISWSHHMVLIDKTFKLSDKYWYMHHCIENGISRNILAMQIESKLFERQIETKKITNFENTLPKPNSDFANYLLKDPYIFDFVQVKEIADERNIEQQLTKQVTKFMLELGQGFAFIGSKVHFEVANTDFYIDLLFYHTKLHAYVVVELKARDFEPSDAGKLNFYINLVNDKLKTATDNDTIGLLLCKGKNQVLAEYALKNINQPIGVSDYQLSKAVPDNLKSNLPNIEDIEKELKE